MFLLNDWYNIVANLLEVFTIQNVPIKYIKDIEKFKEMNHLQYKMFLLNGMFTGSMGFGIQFTIQNVPIKSYLPQTTYIVYHFSSFLSIPIFLYIFIKNFFLSFYKTIKKSNKNRYYRKSVDVPVF